MWRPLVKIKSVREQRAEKAVQLARLQFTQAEEALAKAEERLLTYRQFIVTEEKRLYDTLYQRLVKVVTIEDVRHSVSTLYSNELKYREQVLEKRQGKHTAEENVLNKAKLFSYARQQHSKFIEAAEINRQQEEYDKENRDEELDELFILRYEPPQL